MVVHPDSSRISRVRSYSGYLYHFYYISNTGLSPSMATLSRVFFYIEKADVKVLQPPLLTTLEIIYHSPSTERSGFGLIPVRSSLLRESLLISFFRLLRYFSSPTFLHILNGFGYMVPRKRGGFLHSETPGSKLVWKLPEAYRILQRPSSEVSVKGFFVHL